MGNTNFIPKVDRLWKNDAVIEKEIKPKIILIGPSQSGKSTLINSYVQNEFTPQETTVGIEYLNFKKQYQKFNNVNISIWDSAGLDMFKKVSLSYYKNCDAYVIIIDSQDSKCFEHIKEYYDRIIQYNNEEDISKKYMIYLVINHRKNKIDNFNYCDNIKRICNNINKKIKCFEVNAKDIPSLQFTFDSIFEEITILCYTNNK